MEVLILRNRFVVGPHLDECCVGDATAACATPSTKQRDGGLTREQIIHRAASSALGDLQASTLRRRRGATVCLPSSRPTRAAPIGHFQEDTVRTSSG
jgi:hypothetical protein